MAEATPDSGPDQGDRKGDVSGRTPSGGSALTAPAAESGAGAIQLPAWTKALGWCGVAGLIYLLICAVSIISRGFAGLGSDAAQPCLPSPRTRGSG
ncbi:hypothetical protein [Streptomyces sp. NPDC052042]|uniref:hypothetical protein n=1 Tax=Streptomyces sp. NPDC052042 TaxID=3365683 RepID=UPI0037D41790